MISNIQQKLKKDISVSVQLKKKSLQSALLSGRIKSEYSEPDIGEKGEKNMKKKIVYNSAPADITESIIASETIEDFLPAPEFLVKKEENVKITISLSKSSVEFFKEKAEKAGVPYQSMIKSVIDRYSSHYRKQK